MAGKIYAGYTILGEYERLINRERTAKTGRPWIKSGKYDVPCLGLQQPLWPVFKPQRNFRETLFKCSGSDDKNRKRGIHHGLGNNPEKMPDT